MKQKFCQCCAMPIDNGPYGTEKDGSANTDYCVYCYENGTFTFNGTMEEMIEVCVPHLVDSNTDLTAEQVRNMMQEFFPSLKRWKAV